MARKWPQEDCIDWGWPPSSFGEAGAGIAVTSLSDHMGWHADVNTLELGPSPSPLVSRAGVVVVDAKGCPGLSVGESASW